jgi:hypothetical protein
MISFHSENLFSPGSWLSNYKSIISWFWVISQSKAWRCTSSMVLVHLKIYSLKLIIYLETKPVYLPRRNWITKVQLDYFKINSKRKLIRYLDSWNNLGMALNLLKLLLINPRIWKVCHLESDPICSSRSSNFCATKMKSCKVMKRVINSPSSWDQPPTRMCLRLFSIKSI